MEFAFVFASGTMCVDGGVVAADGALVRCTLPRGPAMSAGLHAAVDGRDVTIPAVDVLGAVRGLHDDTSWTLSGARAQLVAERSDAELVSDAERAAATARLWRLHDTIGPGPVEVRETGTGEWSVTVTATDGTRQQQPATRKSRAAAERLAEKTAEDGRLRELAARTGLPLNRLEALRGADAAPISLDEILRIAAAVGEPPSLLLG